MIEHTPYGVYTHCVPIKKDVKSLIVLSFKKLTSWPRRNLRTDLWENKWLLPKSFNSILSFEKKLKDFYWYMYGQSCPTLCQPMDCMQSTSVLFPRIFQARIMDTVWVAISHFQIQESNPDLLHLLHHHADSLPGRHLGIPKTSIHGWEFELIPWRRLWITQLFIILNKILSLLSFLLKGRYLVMSILTQPNILTVYPTPIYPQVTHLWACRSILLSHYPDTHTLTCNHQSHVVSSRYHQSCRTDPLRGSGLFKIKSKCYRQWDRK